MLVMMEVGETAVNAGTKANQTKARHRATHERLVTSVPLRIALFGGCATQVVPEKSRARRRSCGWFQK